MNHFSVLEPPVEYHAQLDHPYDSADVPWDHGVFPPPASTTTVLADLLNFNDEIFFQNPRPEDINSNVSLSSTLLLNLNSYQDLQSQTNSTPDYPLDYSKVTLDGNYTTDVTGAMHGALVAQSPSTVNMLGATPLPQRNLFSLPIDQLNLLTLRHQYDLKLPSPNQITSPLASVKGNTSPDLVSATINPRQLFNEEAKPPALSPVAADSPPSSVAIPSASNPRNYILPSSTSASSLNTLFHPRQNLAPYPHHHQVRTRKSKSISSGTVDQRNFINALNDSKCDFIMNDECFNAISYWLNNSNLVENPVIDEYPDLVENPTGVAFKRRNSVQVLSKPSYDVSADLAGQALQKRKRRKSHNLDAHPVLLPGSPNLQLLAVEELHLQPPLPLISPVVHQQFEPPQTVVEEDEPKKSDDDGLLKPFPCPECTKVFKRLEHLKRHIRSVHSNIRPFHCKYCEKKFSRSDNLAQHLKTHYKVDENGNSTIIYGNTSGGRGGRRMSRSRT